MEELKCEELQVCVRASEILSIRAHFVSEPSDTKSSS
jgi:hypothetical protein